MAHHACIRLIPAAFLLHEWPLHEWPLHEWPLHEWPLNESGHRTSAALVACWR